ncbi:variola B22R family protein [Turkeypox virus]|uniref:Variola B22R family protein n=1 Tax=Turkeypox virus TaxID=336486 RepID=A0A0M3ZJS0_9POXV|nr:variola B22R family protein [Turkeypox virus]ALA62541.1 variola B22R family protein [Turkeypox virus]
MDTRHILVILSLFVGLSASYQTCARKAAMYHDVEPGNIYYNYESPAYYKAINDMDIKRIKTTELLSLFNWTLIKDEITNNFIRLCEKDTNIFVYNYSIELKVYANNTILDTNTTSKILSKVMGDFNETLLWDEIVNINSTSGTIKEGYFLHYENCNGLKAERFKYTILDRDNERIIELNLTGRFYSLSYQYVESNVTVECIEKYLEDYELDNNITVDITVINACRECSIDFMTDIVGLPYSFKSVAISAGLKNLNDSNTIYMFFRCMILSGDPHCLEYLSMSSFNYNSPFTNNNTYRYKRDLNSDKILDCKYLTYGTTNFNKCSVLSRNRNIRSPVITRYNSINSKSLMDHAKEFLGIQQIIPPGVSHIQLGIKGYDEKSIGDINLYNSVKDKVKDTIVKLLPSINGNSLKEIYIKLLSINNITFHEKDNIFSGIIKETIQQKKDSMIHLLSLLLKENIKKDNYMYTVVYNTVNESGDPEIFVNRLSSSIRNMKFRSVNFSHIDAGEDVGMSSSHNNDMDEIDKAEKNSRIILTKYSDAGVLPDIKDFINELLEYKHSSKNIEESYREIDIVRVNKAGNSILNGIDTSAVIAIPRKDSISRSNWVRVNDDNIVTRRKWIDTEYYNANMPSRREPMTLRRSGRCKRQTGAVCGMIGSQSHTMGSYYEFPRYPSVSSRRNSDTSSSSSSSSSSSRRNSDTSSVSSRRNSDTSSSSSSSAHNTNNRPGIDGISVDNVFLQSSSMFARRISERTRVSSSLKSIVTLYDKAVLMDTITSIIGNMETQRQARRDVIEKRDKLSKEQKVFDSIYSVLTTLGSSLSSAGVVLGPKAMFAGIGITAIAGIIDTIKDVYYLHSNKEPDIDPLVETFETYAKYISNNDRAGTRKCLMPGNELTIYMTYRNDSSFKPSVEKLNGLFLDTIDSEIKYLNTSNIVLDYHLKLVCPIGVLRSLDVDITSYSRKYKTSTDGITYYKIQRLATLLSKVKTVRFTCGKDVALTLRPFEIPLNEMQLLKMTTPGEPASTKNMPSNVCDLYPFKKFFLRVNGCPYDHSQVSIVYTTCSILLRMSTWDADRNRWVLQNPFMQEGPNKQLFIFSKYDFADTVLEPNRISAHSSFCVDKQSNKCYWSEPMPLENVNQCASRVRKLYIKIGLFGDNGYTSFVMSCPFGSTPVYISDDGSSKLIELPFDDYRTTKLFGSDVPITARLFCVNNIDKRFKSDIIVLDINKSFNDLPISLVTYEGKDRLFREVARHMPHRSRLCDSRVHCRYGGVKFYDPKIILEVIHGNQLSFREVYDQADITLQNLQLSKLFYPTPIDITIPVSRLGDAYLDPEMFWKDAKNKYRTYSAIAIGIIPCNIKQESIKIGKAIVTLGYFQSLEETYGDGNMYYFKPIDGSKVGCAANLDLKTKEVSLKCKPYTIPRLSLENYEGMCFIVTTSKDHCGTKDDSIKKYGYTNVMATRRRPCLDDVGKFDRVLDSGHYCFYNVYTGYYPEYSACTSFILVYYMQKWIEKEMLSDPPYIFDYTYSESNEYIDSSLSNKLNELYIKYNELIDYTDRSLSKSINRLANALTDKGREISSVTIDSDILETAYEADKETALQIQDDIKDTVRDIVMFTLTDKQLSDILDAENSVKCCIIDVYNRRVIKYYLLEKYICGNIEDYTFLDTEGKKYIAVNNTLLSYDYLNTSKSPVVTCFEPNIISLDTDDAKKDVEDIILYNSIVDGINEILDGVDRNITLAIISDEVKAREYDEEHRNNKIIMAVLVVMVTMLLVICGTGCIHRNRNINRYYIIRKVKDAENKMEDLEVKNISNRGID